MEDGFIYTLLYYTIDSCLYLSFIIANPWDISADIFFYVDSCTRKSIRTIEKLEHDKLRENSGRM